MPHCLNGTTKFDGKKLIFVVYNASTTIPQFLSQGTDQFLDLAFLNYSSTYSGGGSGLAYSYSFLCTNTIPGKNGVWIAVNDAI
jgi:hypothetical protein